MEQRLVELLRREGQRVWRATPREDHRDKIDLWVVTPGGTRQLPVQATVASDPDILAHKHAQIAGRGIALLAVPHRLLTQAWDADDPHRRDAATSRILELLCTAVAQAGIGVPDPEADQGSLPWQDWLLEAVGRLHHHRERLGQRAIGTPLLRRHRLALLALNALGFGHKRMARLLGWGRANVGTRLATARTELLIYQPLLARRLPYTSPDQRILLGEWVAAADRVHQLTMRPYTNPKLLADTMAWQQVIAEVAGHFALVDDDLLRAATLPAEALRQVRAAPALPSSAHAIELLSRAAAILAEALPASGCGRPPSS